MLVVLTVIIVMPLLVIVLQLLSAADPRFMNIIDHLFSWLSQLISGNLLTYLIELLVAIPVAAYFYGALWGNSRPNDQIKGWLPKENVDSWLSRLHCAPQVMIYTCLVLFNGVYLLFLALQALRLVEALQMGLPHMTTYSEFAREGFFELCKVSAINLMLMGVAWLLATRNGVATNAKAPQVREKTTSSHIPGALRILLAVLSLQTILLVVTAMTKMLLYIQAYGLTRLRVYTAWFMVWLLIVFLVLGAVQVLQLRRQSSGLHSGAKTSASAERFGTAALVKGTATLSIAMFLLLGYCNVDGIIVRENLARFEAGQASAVDVRQLAWMSDNALHELLNYYSEADSRGQTTLASPADSTGSADENVSPSATEKARVLMLRQIRQTASEVYEQRWGEYSDRWDMFAHGHRWYAFNVKSAQVKRQLESLLS